MELGVEQDNVGARSMYLQGGFRVEKVLPDLGFDLMRKQFPPHPNSSRVEGP